MKRELGSKETDIAIIGMSGQFPGAQNIDEFWNNLHRKAGFCSTGANLSNAAAGMNLPRLQGIELFDAEFFGIEAETAKLIDPQHRLFLTESFRALESSGYHSQAFDGVVSVYVSVGENFYLDYNIARSPEGLTAAKDVIELGNNKDYLAARVAHSLNLKNNRYNVQAASSDGLVAVHRACESLLSYECELALAGAVSLDAGLMDHPPSEQLGGFVAGSGVGVVVLKLLDEAIKDGDNIHAVIKSTAVAGTVGKDVGDNAGSNPRPQADVVQQAIADSGIDASTLQYIETDGSGLIDNDVSEIQDINKALNALAGASLCCGVGSVKPGVGHLGIAAGITGLIKTVLMLEHRTLIPSLPSAGTDPLSGPSNRQSAQTKRDRFYYVDRVSEWVAPGHLRRACVNSLGLEGNGAHLVLEQAPVNLDKAAAEQRSNHILTLSAKSGRALENLKDSLHQYCSEHPNANVADIGFTLNVGRTGQPHRYSCVVQNTATLLDKLQPAKADAPLKPTPAQDVPSAAVAHRDLYFIFNPLDKPCENLGLALYLHEQEFYAGVEACVSLLAKHLDFNPLKAFYPALEPLSHRNSQGNLHNTALCVFQYALVKLWSSWGLNPAGVMGFGVGEYVAAQVAKAISLDEMLLLALGSDQAINPDHVGAVSGKAPAITLISGASGRPINEAHAYRARQGTGGARDQFVSMVGLRACTQNSHSIHLEFGAYNSVAEYLSADVEAANKLPYLLSAYRHSHHDDLVCRDVLQTLARLWELGVPLAWDRFYACERRRRLPLPKTPLEPARFWIDPVPLANMAGLGDRPVSSPGAAVAPDTASDVLQIHKQTPLSFDSASHSNKNRLAKASDSHFENSQVVSLFAAAASKSKDRSHQYKAEKLQGQASEISFQKPSVNALVQIQPDPDNVLKPFPLSDTQRASFLVRQQGCVANHTYLELDVSDLSTERLAAAWQSLVSRHASLRTEIALSGLQRVAQARPNLSLKKLDLRAKSAKIQAHAVTTIRARMSHKNGPVQSSFIRIIISRTEAKKTLHLSMDAMVLDRQSILILLKEWGQLYKDPQVALSSQNIAFRDCVLALADLKKTAIAESHLAYWCNKYPCLPGGPKLATNPSCTKNPTDLYDRQPFVTNLKANLWQSLKTRLGRLGISSGDFLLGVFSETLKCFCPQDPFSVLLGASDRQHALGLDDMVAAMSAPSLCVIGQSRQPNFIDSIRSLQKILRQDAQRNSVNLSQIIAELKKMGAIGSEHSLPVAFESLLDIPTSLKHSSLLDRVDYLCFQAPYVYLNNLVYEHDGELIIHWSVARDYYAEGLIEKMFAVHTKTLNLLAADVNASQLERWPISALWQMQSPRGADQPWSNSLGGNSSRNSSGDLSLGASKDTSAGLKRSPVGTGARFEIRRHAQKRYAPYPLTPHQQTLFDARSINAFEAGSFIYREFEVVDLDLSRLTIALQKLVDAHDILSTMIKSDGTLQLLPDVPPVEIRTTGMRGILDDEKGVPDIKSAMVERIITFGGWPNFDVQMSPFTSRLSIVYFCIDTIIADTYSVDCLQRALFYFYDNPLTHVRLQPVGFSDYVFSQLEYQKSESHQKSLLYWQNKLCAIAPNPKLPARVASVKVTQLNARIRDWCALERLVARWRVGADALFISIFADILAQSYGVTTITFLIKGHQRPPIHKDINKLVGDYSTKTWLTVDTSISEFKGRVKLAQAEMEEDKAHMMTDGQPAIDALPAVKSMHHDLGFPFVYMNLKHQGEFDFPEGVKLQGSSVHEPMVPLTLSSVLSNGNLTISMDAAMVELGPIQTMFTQFKQRLADIVSDADSEAISDSNSEAKRGDLQFAE